MFVEYLERYLSDNKITPDIVHRRYVRFTGKKCLIKIWMDSRVEIFRKGKRIRYFKFNEPKLKKFLYDGGDNEKL